MSQFSNYAENKIADYFRGQGITLPASWYLAFLSAYTESSATEVGVGLARVGLTRALGAWAGTQGAGTTAASSGTSHTTSNNTDIAMGTASGSATAVAIGLFDAASGGNCWMVFELAEALDIAASDTPVVTAGTISFAIGVATGLSDYASNKMVDLLWRGQAYAWPANLYASLSTGSGEIGGGVGYARAVVPSTMVQWSGTQGPGTTTGSTGIDGRISNNVAVPFPAPTGSWGTVSSGGLHDAATAGNLMMSRALHAPRTVSDGSPAPTYATDQLDITIA